MKLTLPMPPSVNHLYANIPGRGRVISGNYQRWKKAAKDQLWLQKWSRVEGPVRLTIALERTGQRYDCSNRVKAVEDFLVQHGIISDDNHKIVQSVLVFVADVKGCEVQVHPI